MQAFVNCASEYVADAVENYQKGKRGWDMFVPDLPAEKYAGAAVGGAIQLTNLPAISLFGIQSCLPLTLQWQIGL